MQQFLESTTPGTYNKINISTISCLFYCTSGL
uniref:A/G-specific adenine DNA glycosylase n=1 Tax=Arundo donax TaxID=35708 RepID=A0A0A9HP46_ARUDO